MNPCLEPCIVSAPKLAKTSRMVMSRCLALGTIRPPANWTAAQTIRGGDSSLMLSASIERCAFEPRIPCPVCIRISIATSFRTTGDLLQMAIGAFPNPCLKRRSFRMICWNHCRLHRSMSFSKSLELGQRLDFGQGHVHVLELVFVPSVLGHRRHVARFADANRALGAFELDPDIALLELHVRQFVADCGHGFESVSPAEHIEQADHGSHPCGHRNGCGSPQKMHFACEFHRWPCVSHFAGVSLALRAMSS